MVVTRYQEIEAKHPELRAYDTFSAAWYRAWRDAHLAMFPDCDIATRENLDGMVRTAEERERGAAEEIHVGDHVYNRAASVPDHRSGTVLELSPASQMAKIEFADGAIGFEHVIYLDRVA